MDGCKYNVLLKSDRSCAHNLKPLCFFLTKKKERKKNHLKRLLGSFCHIFMNTFSVFVSLFCLVFGASHLQLKIQEFLYNISQVIVFRAIFLLYFVIFFFVRRPNFFFMLIQYSVQYVMNFFSVRAQASKPFDCSLSIPRAVTVLLFHQQLIRLVRGELY